MTTQELVFTVVDWMAWMPGLAERDAWQRWAEGRLVPGEAQDPQVGFVRARQRRRLSRFSKMTMYAAHHCLGARDDAPARTVFASRHGELTRTLQMLEQMVQGGDVSPTQFALSVHNTSASLFSIARGCRAPATALAAGPDTFHYALLEAIGWLQNQREGLILLVVADEPLPAAYEQFADESEMAHAVAMLLAQPDTPAQGVRIKGCVGDPGAASLPVVAAEASLPVVAAEASLPWALRWLRWLLTGDAPLDYQTQQQSTWRWSKDGRDAE